MGWLKMVFKKWVLLFGFICAWPLSAEKHTLSVCSVFKNEDRYLKEWIEFHQMIGVDHFYLYNVGSNDSSINILSSYVEEGVVTLIHWPESADQESFIWFLNSKIAAYENACKVMAARDTRWLVFLDINEFLVPVQESSIQTVLERYVEYPGLILQRNYFDASDGTGRYQNQLLIETVKMSGNSVLPFDQDVKKIIFQPKFCKGFTWFPYRCLFQHANEEVCLDAGSLRINHYMNRFQGNLHFGKYRSTLRVDNRAIDPHVLTQLLDEGYQIEDHEKVAHRWIPALKARLEIQ